MPDPTSVFQSPQTSSAQPQGQPQPQPQSPQFSAQPSVAESPSFSQAGATVAMADPSHIQKSPFRFLPFILGGLLVFGIIFFIVSRVIGGLKQSGPSISTTPPAGSDTQTGGVARPGGSQKTITYWGLWEPSAAMTDVLSEFQKQNNVVVQYERQLPKEYRERLQDAGVPWVIENVVGAPLPLGPTLDGRYGVMLCGTEFGMRVYRHRIFESNYPLHGNGGCSHTRLAMNPHNQAARDLMYEEFGRQDPEKIWRREMGVEWMGKYEARESVPPAFTEHIGHQLIQQLERTAAAA